VGECAAFSQFAAVFVNVHVAEVTREGRAGTATTSIGLLWIEVVAGILVIIALIAVVLVVVVRRRDAAAPPEAATAEAAAVYTEIRMEELECENPMSTMRRWTTSMIMSRIQVRQNSRK
jgi:hypothetical protein